MIMKTQLKNTTVLALLMTTTYAMAEENTAEINQTGENNQAVIEQVGIFDTYFNTATITQIGDNNEANIDQTADDVNTSTIEQTGSFNYAQAVSAGFMGSIDITQFGESNEAIILGGSEDFASISQGDPSISSPSNYNIASIDQTGCGQCSHHIVQSGFGANEAFILATHEGAYATITQDGAYNYTSLSQVGNPGALITQSGEDNYVYIEQSYWSDVSVEQTGELHQAVIQQDWGFNTNASVVTNGGSANQVDIEQTGDVLQADVRQFNVFESMAVIEQYAEGQTTWIEQHNGIGNYATVSQGLGGSIGNSASVVQYGSYNIANIVQ